MQKQLLIGFLILVYSPASGQIISDIYKQLKSTEADTTRIRLYTKLATLYKEKNHFDSTYIYARKGIQLSETNHINSYKGELYYLLGTFYDLKATYDKSLQMLKMAHQFSPYSNDKHNSEKVLYALSKIYIKMGKYNLAIRQALENLTYFEKTRNSWGVARTYILLVSVYADLRNAHLHTLYLNRYLEYIRHTTDVEGKLFAYILKAGDCEDKKEYLKAWSYRLQTLKLARSMKGGEQYVVNTLVGLGANLYYRQQYKESVTVYKEAIQACRQLNDPLKSAESQSRIAQSYLKAGDTLQALKAAKEGLQLARQHQELGLLITSLVILAEVQEAAREPAALQTYKEYYFLKDSLLALNKLAVIEKIQAQYDLEKKEHTIHLLNKNTQLQRHTLATEQKQRLALLLSLATLAISLTIVIYLLQRANQLKTLLVNQAEHLQESNGLKDKLFSILAHDLRSPVASLKTTFLALKLRKREQQDIDGLEEQVDQLYFTLDNVLHWSLNQQNGLQVSPRLVILRNLINEVLAGFKGLIIYKELTILVDGPPVLASLDETLLALVLRNVIHNAIKFTPPQGSIHISIYEEKDTTGITIQDSGVGMEINQMDQPVSLTGQGTGLGLRVSQELMSRNNGKLSIESQPEQGTTVTLSWPNFSNN